jgi:cell division septation protein DedD
MRRARLVGVVSAAALAAVMLAVPGRATAASADEAKVLALTNQVRASSGLPALAFDETLAANARTWAAKMAGDGIISHNKSLSSQLTGWFKLSENVGQGPDIDTVHRALVASPPHYKNMTDTEVTMMGAGVVYAGNSVFMVEVFMGRGGAAVVNRPPATAPPTTVAKAAVTTAPKAPAAPRATTTTVPAPAPEASPWMTLALEVTRAWERASG